MRPNPNKRKGSENRKPTGDRERNVGHPNGEEHSRVPKGNRGVRRIEDITDDITIMNEVSSINNTRDFVVVTLAFVVIAIDDASGVGVADDALLIPLGILWWDYATNLYN
jgi:hypothetical protein